jgi:hypothetical protein
MLIYINYCLIFLAGACGAFLNDVLKDNCLELPKKINGVLILGFLGGMLIGGASGLAIDGSLSTALMGGFTGKEVLTRLIQKRN